MKILTKTTINPLYKRWFRTRHHEEIPFEPLATTINILNFNERIDENSIYSFAGDLKAQEIQDAFAKLSSQKRQKIVPEIRQLLIKIHEKENVVIGKFLPVSLKKFVDHTEFTELDYLMSRPQEMEKTNTMHSIKKPAESHRPSKGRFNQAYSHTSKRGSSSQMACRCFNSAFIKSFHYYLVVAVVAFLLVSWKFWSSREAFDNPIL